ncbi:MAG: hypothetical protein QOI69_1789, partial [Pseudonocardiales bacterium]|nr:hypothetical protein [Pseudonocardiales bacterium]
MLAESYGVLTVLLSRSATGEGFHGLPDADNVALDVLQVEPSSHNLIVSDFKKSHAAHLKALPVAAGTRPM